MHTLAEPIHYAERNFPEHNACVCGTVRLNFSELAHRCRRLKGHLTELGLEPGDRVAILAANSHQYVEVYMGIPAAGFVVVPLNTRHAVPELAYALKDADARVSITDRDPGSLANLVEHVILVPDGYERGIAGAQALPLGIGIREDSLAGLFYTGGTTGHSKGVMLSHRNLIANCWHWMSLAQPTETDRFLVMAPLFHAAGSNSVIASIWTGGAQVLLPQFNATATLELIEQEAITMTLGVPTMIAALAEAQLQQPRQTSTLRVLGHGGSPIATEVVRRANRAFPAAEMIHVYGATETAPLATALRHEQSLVDSPRARSCGRPIVGVSIRIVDPEMRDLTAGQVGEVAIRGPNVMAGYWNKPEQTQRALVDGWYRSGDLGYQDPEGFLFLVDRAKDMIVSGGENVYCSEVEEVLYRHPAVLEAAVFGIPDEKWGEAVHAAVVLRSAVETAELIEFCRGFIAGYKVPRGIDVWEKSLPQSGPGKILKRELRAPYWKDQDKSIH